MTWNRVAHVALAAAVLVAAGVQFHEPIRLTFMVWQGRSPHCPWRQAIHSGVHRRLLTETKDRILAASRLVRTDAGGLELWDTPEGEFWIPAGNRYTLPFNLAEQRLRLYDSARVRVRPGDVVLDCGANVGVYTRASLRAGAAKVVAIEPLPQNVECLRRNFAPEIARGEVVLYPKGVWDCDSVLTLRFDPGDTAAATFLDPWMPASRAVEAPLTTIDKLAAELDLDRVDIIKMDIEGAEPRALAGSAAVLRRFRPGLAISAYHRPQDPVDIPATVAAALADYRLECGICTEVDHSLIRPDVLFFY